MVERVTVDAYVLDTLMPDLVGHDRMASALVVFLFLWRHTNGGRKQGVALSHTTVAEGTGLSKRGVQIAIARLRRRRLVTVHRRRPTATPEYGVVPHWRPKRAVR